MVKCCSVNCESSSHKKSPGVTFHRFPKDDRKQLWLVNMGLQGWKPKPNSVLCSKHFETKYLNPSSFCTRLRPGAIPTLHAKLPKIENVQPEKHLKATSSVLQDIQNKIESKIVRNETQLKSKVKPIIVSCQPTTSTHRFCTAKSTQTEKDILHEKNKKLQGLITKKNKRLKALTEQRRQLKKKVAHFSNVIFELKKRLQNEDVDILSAISASNTDFLVRYVKKVQNKSLDKTYSPELRAFALQLNFFSPRAYNFVRETFQTILPHPATISRWYKKVNAEPGFTAESFNALKNYVAMQTQYKTYVSLCLDEMAIRKGLIWDNSREKFVGYVNVGTEVYNDSLPLATQALVFMVTAINASWKLPIAYFFIHSLNSEQRANLVQIAIQMLYDIQIYVVALTFDGAASNIAMTKILGSDVEQNKPYFFYKEVKVHIFYDPCHMLKLIRNTYGDFKVIIDSEGKEINFRYIEKLVELQDKKGLHLANKLKDAHINYSKQKMKVRLAAQVLSNSVADALLHCKDVLKMPEFNDCAATVKFIKIINNCFDILNSRSLIAPGFKKALLPANIEINMRYIQECIDYITKLKLLTGQLIVQSPRKTGFVGFIICLKSAINIYHDLIVKENFKFLPIYKMSQDHLEMFFGMIRMKGGFNDNPNIIQFKIAYKKNLIYTELKGNKYGNCIPLQNIAVLTASSTEPVKLINDTTSNINKVIYTSTDQIDETEIDSFTENILSLSLDEYSNHITTYIAGFVVRRVLKNINCVACKMMIVGNKDDMFFSLIRTKDRGGLTYPSKGVVLIIQHCEKMFKYLKPSTSLFMQRINEAFDISKIFDYSNDDTHDAFHSLLLIKGIVQLYIKIRCIHEAKKASTNVSKRNYFKKIILFENK